MQPLGELFTAFGSYIVGGFELITSLILLAPALLWTIRKLGGKAPNSNCPAYDGAYQWVHDNTSKGSGDVIVEHIVVCPERAVFASGLCIRHLRLLSFLACVL